MTPSHTDSASSPNDRGESVRIPIRTSGDASSSSGPVCAYNLPNPLRAPTCHVYKDPSRPFRYRHLAALHGADPVGFVTRVSKVPLVNTILQAYDQLKTSSKVVKARLSPISMCVDLKPAFSMAPA